MVVIIRQQLLLLGWLQQQTAISVKHFLAEQSQGSVELRARGGHELSGSLIEKLLKHVELAKGSWSLKFLYEFGSGKDLPSKILDIWVDLAENSLVPIYDDLVELDEITEVAVGSRFVEGFMRMCFELSGLL